MYRTGCIVVGLAALLLCACATTAGERISRLRPGMTQAQVIDVLGQPDGYRRNPTDGTESLLYTNRLVSGWAWDRADYAVTLKDGTVVAYGAEAVRQDQSHHTTTVVPLKPLR